MRSRHALGFGIASMLALGVAPAYAQQAATPGATITGTAPQSAAARVIQVASGKNRGRIDGAQRLRYPGFEQSTVVYSKNHIVLITMEAVQEPNRGPVQCSCSSYELRPDGAPIQRVNLKRLTEYSNGERTCNHPKAAADENGNIVWLYGSDSNDNQPNTYAGILNEKCEHLAAPQMVSIQRNANDGAPDVAYNGNGLFTAGYYSDGGTPLGPFPAEGGDYSVAMGLQIEKAPDALLPTLRRTWITPIVTPTDIGRPTIAALDATRSILCAPKGPARPSDHIECGIIDVAMPETAPGETARVLWKSQVFEGNRQQRLYYNQPTIVKVADNRLALLAIESNAMGKGSNVKGSNVSHLLMLERNGDTLVKGGDIVGAAAHQTHASMCTGNYGEQGAPAVAVFSASPTGIGRAAMMMLNYEESSKAFRYDPKADLWPAAWYGDSGHLSNWYGRNPMNQGRDYMRCIGGVPNPGYHVPNGFMADVKTFFVAPVQGRIPGEEKNALFLSFVPGQMDKKPIPQNPVVAGTGEGLNEDGTIPEEKPKDSSGCGCSTPGQTSNDGALAMGALLGLGAIVSMRRRRR